MKNLKRILEASYLNQKQADKKLSSLGYTYDPELSTNDSKVFTDANGNPNIAFRGTHKMRIKDLISDGALLLGLEKYDNRFKEAKHLTQLVEDKYSKPANVFGHSLSGKLAEDSGAHGKVTTFNKAVGVLDIGKTIPKNQTDIRTHHDLVSLLSTTQHHDGRFKEIKDKGLLDAHGLNNL